MTALAMNVQYTVFWESDLDNAPDSRVTTNICKDFDGPNDDDKWETDIYSGSVLQLGLVHCHMSAALCSTSSSTTGDVKATSRCALQAQTSRFATKLRDACAQLSNVWSIQPLLLCKFGNGANADETIE